MAYVRLGVPAKLRSCHTCEMNGYAIEGNVPAANVKRILAIRLTAAELTASGMVMGSPGLKAGGRSGPYQTVLFDEAGETRVLPPTEAHSFCGYVITGFAF